MPKYRKLHTKTIDSLDVAAMPDDFTRLTWVMLPLISCRDGRGLFHGHWLRSKMYPLRADVTPDMMINALGCFESMDMITLYVVDGRQYYQINNWSEYQGNTTKESPSDYPPIPEVEKQLQTNSGVTLEQLQNESSTDAVFNIQYSDANAKRARAHTRGNDPPQTERMTPKIPNAYLGLIPTHIATESFLASWNDWIEYHAERGKPLTKSTAKAQLRELGQLPPGEGEQRIQQSIAQGWTGLFELKSSKNGQHGDSDLWPQLLSLMKQSAPALKMPPETPENLRRFAKSLGGWRSMCQLPEYELKQRLQQVQA